MRLIILALFLLVASGGATTVNSQRKASGGPVNPKELEQFLDGFFDQHMQKEHIPEGSRRWF